MAALLLAIACKLPATSPSDQLPHGGSDTSSGVDVDQDGYDAAIDCNDLDASVHPGTKEICGNQQDDNCNGSGDGCPWEGETTIAGWELAGNEADEQFGSTLAVCDADGDGQDDLVVGSAGTNEDAGAVHVFYGPFGEDTAIPRVWTILGTGPSTTFGSALDCQSDMTGDGAADLVIGEPDETGKTAGAMYVVPGGGTGVTAIADAYASVWNGAYATDRFGYGVLAMDADGSAGDEIAVTALGVPGMWESTQYGVAYVLGSSPGSHIASTAEDYVFGEPGLTLQGTIGNAGDTNGDGIAGLALTAQQGPHWDDLALLYQQGVSGPIAADDADVIFATGGSFVARYTQLGHAELTGDGYDDFLLGDPDAYEYRGAVLVFHGPLDGDTNGPPDAELIGREGSHAGTAIASPGDLDGDGEDDLLIGAPGDGGVYLHQGGDSGYLQLDHTAQASFWRAEDASEMGATVGVGSLTADDLGEFVFGAPLAGEENKGAVVLIPSLDL